MNLIELITGKPTTTLQQTYNKNHCWQYDIRLRNRERDLREANITDAYANTLRTADFTFKHITDKAERLKLIEFIKRHEWLGTITQYTTHWFGAYHKNLLAGVILMSMPNAFSNLLGDNTRDLERLISRGACISWSLLKIWLLIFLCGV